jgi:hypothetical protein
LSRCAVVGSGPMAAKRAGVAISGVARPATRATVGYTLAALPCPVGTRFLAGIQPTRDPVSITTGLFSAASRA